FPTRRSSDLGTVAIPAPAGTTSGPPPRAAGSGSRAVPNPFRISLFPARGSTDPAASSPAVLPAAAPLPVTPAAPTRPDAEAGPARSEEHTSELQSRENLVCRLLLEK